MWLESCFLKTYYVWILIILNEINFAQMSEISVAVPLNYGIHDSANMKSSFSSVCVKSIDFGVQCSGRIEDRGDFVTFVETVSIEFVFWLLLIFFVVSIVVGNFLGGVICVWEPIDGQIVLLFFVGDFMTVFFLIAPVEA